MTDYLEVETGKVTEIAVVDYRYRSLLEQQKPEKRGRKYYDLKGRKNCAMNLLKVEILISPTGFHSPFKILFSAGSNSWAN